jgi:hypothetical protein
MAMGHAFLSVVDNPRTKEYRELERQSGDPVFFWRGLFDAVKDTHLLL